MTEFIGEKLEKTTPTKEIFFYYDEAKKVKQLSREVFRKRDEVVHYPRGKDTPRKYNNIEKIRFLGFEGKLPVGVLKSSTIGYGFTRTLGKFAAYVDEQFGITEIVIEKGGKVDLDRANKKLYLSESALRILQNSFTALFDRQRGEVRSQISQHLYSFFKTKVSKPKNKYAPGALAASLACWENSIGEFSVADKKAIQALFDKLSLTDDFLTEDLLTKTKEIVDNKYIQDALSKFKELMALVTEGDALERRWQTFLKTNAWIFSSIFAQPIILHKDEAYVGGKTLQNKDGKVSDFLIKNDLSDNISFLEIKTHKTPILEVKPYRGTDVYSATKELTGCVSQVLNQRDNLQKEYYALRGKSDQVFETLNSKCVVLIGSLSNLTAKQKRSFELFRSNSRDVDILTFDELQKKIEALQTLVKKQLPKTTKSSPKKST